MDNWPNQGLFELAVEQAFDSVLITTAELDLPGPQIVYANNAFCERTGYSREELMGLTPRILQGPLTDPKVLKRLRQNLEQGVRFEGATINYRKDGTPYIVHWSISPMRNAANEITHFVSVQRDITHESQLETFNERLLDSLGEGVFGIDTQGNCTFVNPAALQMLGYEHEDELIGQNSHTLIHHSHPDGSDYPLEDCPIFQIMRDGTVVEPWRDHFWTKQGKLIPVEVAATPLMPGVDDLFGGVFIFRNISEQIQLEEELKAAASHDQLTGAYNRRFADQILHKELARFNRFQQPVTLILADIDHFKVINDTYGHLVGDDVLQQFVDTLDARLRDTDYLVRWGGEEFLMILPDTDKNGALELAEALRAQVAEQPYADANIDLTASFGVSELGEHDAIETWLQRADRALYEAKHNGRNRVVLGE
jgi:diguanylate cyclase (GGDEF)-like protein/PAS domain S-box-containing protein